MRQFLAVCVVASVASCTTLGPNTPPESQALSPLSLDPGIGPERTLACGPTKIAVWREPADSFHVISMIRFLGTDSGGTAEPAQEMAFPGSFHSLCNQGRFLVVADDPHFEIGPSFLIKGDSTLAADLSLGFAPRVSVSRDHKLFWAQTHEGDGVPETRLRVFDFNGRPLLDQRYTTDGAIAAVSYDGQIYRMAVEKPALPG
jgi:hypothetical protein